MREHQKIMTIPEHKYAITMAGDHDRDTWIYFKDEDDIIEFFTKPGYQYPGLEEALCEFWDFVEILPKSKLEEIIARKMAPESQETCYCVFRSSGICIYCEDYDIEMDHTLMEGEG